MKQVKKKNSSFSLKLIVVFLITFVVIVTTIVFSIIKINKMKEQDAINNFSAPGRYIYRVSDGDYREIILRDDGSCYFHGGMNPPVCNSYIKSEGKIILNMWYSASGYYELEYEILPDGNLSGNNGGRIYERQ